MSNNVPVFLDKLDFYLQKHDLKEANNFLEASLDKAIKEKDTPLIILVLNEMIGFYRDLTQYETSLKYAKSLKGLLERLNLDDNTVFVSLINIANAYRAASLHEEALLFFIEAKNLYETKAVNNKKEYAALLNNLALLYSALKQYEEALNTFNLSLSLLDEKDIYRIATCYTNIANCYLSLNKRENAHNYLLKAKEIFEKDEEKDFHYSGYLAAYARYLEITDSKEAVAHYEKALSYLEETVGFNAVYLDIKNHLKKLLMANGKERESLLDITEAYYNEYMKDNLELLHNSILEKIVVGAFGFGSDKFYLDDEISEDHDYEPGFIILIKDGDIDTYNILKKMYDSLPKHYRRFFIKNEAKRNGVFYLNDWLSSIGIKKEITEESAYFLDNGKIFLDRGGIMRHLRAEGCRLYEDSHLEKIYRCSIKLSQIAEYNLKRMQLRNDMLSYHMLESEFKLEFVRLVYLLNHVYYTQVKQSLRRALVFNKVKELNIYLEKSFSSGLEEKDYEAIFKYLVKYFADGDFLIKKESNCLIDYQYELKDNVISYYEKKEIIRSIIKYEWQMFQETKNEGGRANCQDNYDYFFLMRSSQYYALDMLILKSFLNDLKEAKKSGKNLIAYKYAYMEESTAYEDFLKIKGMLPVISEKRKALQEEIIKIQLSQLESFLLDYPKAKEYIRKVYTKEDTKADTSYETYLRGELSTYNDKTLINYANYLIQLERNGESIAKKVISKTCYLANINIDIYK